MRIIVEIEETVSLRDYKTIRTRICLESESEDETIEILNNRARAGLKDGVRNLLKSINSKNLLGGVSSQWAYREGRRKKSEA